MFEAGLERTIVATAAVLWFAHGWYLNTRLLSVHAKLDRVLHELAGLREYMYEIDPQFDDERASWEYYYDDQTIVSGMDAEELVSKKEAEGKRTLRTPFNKP